MKSVYRTYSDLELTALMPADDRAFAEVYNWNFGVIYAFVSKMLQDDDMTQEIFLTLYENRTSSGISSLRTYL